MKNICSTCKIQKELYYSWHDSRKGHRVNFCSFQCGLAWAIKTYWSELVDIILLTVKPDEAKILRS